MQSLTPYSDVTVMQLHQLRAKSKMIDAIGFSEAEGRGSLRVQFKDKDGNVTVAGDYLDVPRQVFNVFQDASNPDQFLNQHVKPHFKWSPLEKAGNGESDEGVGCGCIDGKDGGKW